MRIAAPAKLNLSLLVSPPRSDGLHPLDSIVQTIEWCDVLEIEEGEGDDSLEITGDIEVEVENNLVLKAVTAIRSQVPIPPLHFDLRKEIPIGAGLGGGSSDAAAALLAACQLGDLPLGMPGEIAPSVGADVKLFLTGGSLLMSGSGEHLEPVEPLTGFAVAVVVPEFGLATADVYRRWDELGGPVGPLPRNESLPPSLRKGMPMRNDLLPAALEIIPQLGDLIADVEDSWGVPVFMTGSGSACFGYFSSLEEAEDAAAGVASLFFVAKGVALRERGVAAVDR